MPLINSNYKKPWFLFNRHLETIYPSRYRKVDDIDYIRERLELNDGDFIDLDWSKIDKYKQTKYLVIITHGLEGSSKRTYVKGIVKYFNNKKWDALAWNCRSCSGEVNRLKRFYHHGDFLDLDNVIKHSIKKGYKNIALIGGSMGGSITIKYLANVKKNKNIIGVAVYSTPIDLGESASILDKKNRKFYRKRFINSLKNKIKLKEKKYPGLLPTNKLDEINLFYEFDKYYTAPLHGYKSPEEYYKIGTTIDDLKKIKKPLYICTAINDPFLGPNSFPYNEIKNNDNITLETPKHGGHLGFYIPKNNTTYTEVSSYQFFSNIINKSQ